MPVSGLLNHTTAIIVIVIGLLSGSLAVVREIQLMYAPAKANDRRVFWSFVRIAFVLAAVLLWLDEHNKGLQLSQDAEATRARIRVETIEPHIMAESPGLKFFDIHFYPEGTSRVRAEANNSYLLFSSQPMNDSEIESKQDELLKADGWAEQMTLNRYREINPSEKKHFSIPNSPGQLEDQIQHEWDNVKEGKTWMYFLVTFKYKGDRIPRNLIGVTEWCGAYYHGFSPINGCGRTRSFLEQVPKGFKGVQ